MGQLELGRDGGSRPGRSWEQAGAEQKGGRGAEKFFVPNNPSLRLHNSHKANMSKVLTSVSEVDLTVKGVTEKSREK